MESKRTTDNPQATKETVSNTSLATSCRQGRRRRLQNRSLDGSGSGCSLLLLLGSKIHVMALLCMILQKSSSTFRAKAWTPAAVHRPIYPKLWKQRRGPSLIFSPLSATLSTTTSAANESSTLDSPLQNIDKSSIPSRSKNNNGGIVVKSQKDKIQELTDSWRTLPDLNPTIQFKTWIIPKGKNLQRVVQHADIQPFLASRHPLVEHMQGRVKVIRDFPDNGSHDDDNNDNEGASSTLSKTCKLVLLQPDTPPWDELDPSIREILHDCHGDGPTMPLSFSYHNFTASFILQTVLPETAHPPPTAFETIGHVAHLNLRAPHLPYRYLIGQILVETLPTIETVIQKVGEVQGPYRTYDLEVLAGRSDTSVQLTESGVSLEFNVKDVYWCSRLSQERQRLLHEEIKDGQWVADAFCGVGALILQAAQQKHCRISANDWNPAAVEALRQNVQRNGVANQFIDMRCGDAYEFLLDLGTAAATTNEDSSTPSEALLPDHIHMNYPLEAPSFLGALRWWPVSRKSRSARKRRRKDKDLAAPRVHVYTFARADLATNRTAEEMAVDLVAEELLPMGPDATHRWMELNDDYDCSLAVHHVRDVAPGKLVVCVSFSVTQKLLRYMQGDFS